MLAAAAEREQRDRGAEGAEGRRFKGGRERELRRLDAAAEEGAGEDDGYGLDATADSDAEASAAVGAVGTCEKGEEGDSGGWVRKR